MIIDLIDITKALLDADISDVRWLFFAVKMLDIFERTYELNFCLKIGDGKLEQVANV